MNYDPHELDAGTKIEHEHTQDDRLARKIAMDHLAEDPHYYSKLKAAGLEDEVEEGALTPLEAGMGENDAEVIQAPVAAPETAVAVVKVAAQPAAGQAPLTSSGLGKNGVNKPLTSDKLDAPETKKVGPNKVASTKTPPLSGDSLHTDSTPAVNTNCDAMDHFGSEIMGLTEGGSQIKKK